VEEGSGWQWAPLSLAGEVPSGERGAPQAASPDPTPRTGATAMPSDDRVSRRATTVAPVLPTTPTKRAQIRQKWLQAGSRRATARQGCTSSTLGGKKGPVARAATPRSRLVQLNHKIGERPLYDGRRRGKEGLSVRAAHAPGADGALVTLRSSESSATLGTTVRPAGDEEMSRRPDTMSSGSAK